MAGLPTFLVGPLNGGRSSTSTITTTVERGSGEGVHQPSFAPCEDLTLRKAGGLKEALHRLDQPDIQVDPNTYVCLLQQCMNGKSLSEGKQVHAHITKSGLKPSTFLLNTIVNMYVKCGSMAHARQLFDKMPERNLFTWTILIAGYARHGFAVDGFKTYKQMQGEGMMPNIVTFTCVLNACASLGALGKGKEVHADIIKAGIMCDIILENALVNMYAKCGSMNEAHQVFANMAQRDVVSWNTMITGYAQHGFGREAFELYGQMQQEEVAPDRVTFICTLGACASLGALEMGKEVHASSLKARITSDINLETALVDMYAKCGSINEARCVFGNMAQRNVVSWNAMITGCAQHGCGREALHLFEQMQQQGLKPNCTTFVALLYACSHVGLVDEGCHYYCSMNQYHGLTPMVEHFGCMVDLLGRAGQLDKAEDFLKKMQNEPDMSVCGALLGSCRIHGDLKLAEHAAKWLLK